jgi:dTDP-glucose 4,6-dehydratase
LEIENDLEFVYQNILDISKSFRNKTFFITGGTGFFGKWILEFFIFLNEKKDINITTFVLSRSPEDFLDNYPKFQKDYIKFIKGDIRYFTFVDEQIDYILHLSATNAQETFNNQDSLDKFESSAYSIKRILEFAKIKSIKKFIFASSGSIYGKNCQDKFISEECLLAPNILDTTASALPEGKRVSEFYCSYYASKYDLNITIARCFSFVGAYLPLDIHYAVGNFIKDAQENSKIIINGDGTAFRSYMYMSDLLIWLFTILMNGKSNEAYNVGNNEIVSIKELANLVANSFEKTIDIEIKNQNSLKTSAPNSYLPNITKAQNELNLNIKIPIDIAIQKTIKSYYDV